MSFFGPSLTERLLFLILIKLERIMVTQAELAADLSSLQQQVSKIGGETQTLIAKVAALEEAINSGPAVTQEVQDALASLKDQVSVVDNLVADA